MEWILFLIALFATTLGSLVGLGGGIIIKPLLDLSNMSVLAVGSLSSLTVLAMSMVSSAKHIYAKRINLRVLYLAVGAMIGGIIGNITLKWLAADPVFLKELQSISLAIVLALILVMMRVKNYMNPVSLQNKIGIVFVGLILGVISSFLGIGGGPLNMIILYLLFGLNAKDSAASSVFIIMFSQATKLFFIAEDIEWSYLMFMIPGGIIGGYLGAFYNTKVSDRVVTIVFNVMIFAMILLNLYNYGFFGVSN